jgi:methionyl-tRNA synthetase
MLGKKLGGTLANEMDFDGAALYARVLTEAPAIAENFEARDFAKVVNQLRTLADETNKYFDAKAPWNLIKTDEEETRKVLTTTLNIFRFMAIALKPILPNYADNVAALFNEGSYSWADIQKKMQGGKIGEYTHLANRIESDKISAMVEASKEEVKKVEDSRALKTTAPVLGPATAANAASAKAATAPTEAGTLDIDTFNKVDLRIGRIIKAETIPEADKLLKLQIDLGPLGLRQVFAGIKSAYDPATLEGRLTVVVANLAPRKMKFGMSEGMVLAASDPAGGGGKGLFILSPDDGAKPGDRVK